MYIPNFWREIARLCRGCSYAFTRLHQGCSEAFTRLLRGCSDAYTRLYQGFYEAAPMLIRGFTKAAPRLLQGCSKASARLLRGCGKAAPRLLPYGAPVCLLLCSLIVVAFPPSGGLPRHRPCGLHTPAAQPLPRGALVAAFTGFGYLGVSGYFVNPCIEF